MLKARFHINKVEVPNVENENWSAFASIKNVSAVCFCQNGRYCAFATSSPTQIALWDVRSILYPMTTISKYTNDSVIMKDGEAWICQHIYWSHKNSRLGCIFQNVIQNVNPTDSVINISNAGEEDTENNSRSLGNTLLVVYDVSNGQIVAEKR